MQNYRNILVVIDPTSNVQKALLRAIELVDKIITVKKAASDDFTITAFCAIYDFSYEMTSFLSNDERDMMRKAVIDDHKKQLQEILSKHKSKVTVNCEIAWHNRPFEAIIDQVNNSKCDLVIKATHHHSKLKSIIFTPTDWHLIRKCPCPVLLVKDHSWPTNGNIIAAVNIACEEDENINLNKKITKLAQGFAELMQSNLHLVNSYPGTPVNISIEIPEFNVCKYNSAMKENHLKAMKEHAEHFCIDIENTHVLEGLPEHVISDSADKLDAELVVLGSIGRTGVSGALIGNTAEQVLDSLNCDVLAVKPEGFED